MRRIRFTLIHETYSASYVVKVEHGMIIDWTPERVFGPTEMSLSTNEWNEFVQILRDALHDHVKSHADLNELLTWKSWFNQKYPFSIRIEKKQKQAYLFLYIEQPTGLFLLRRAKNK